MKSILFSKQVLISLLLIVFVCIAGLLVRKAFAAPARPQAVVDIERDMAVQVPDYNVLAPELTKNRAALEALGYTFDDKTLKAVPLQ